MLCDGCCSLRSAWDARSRCQVIDYHPLQRAWNLCSFFFTHSFVLSFSVWYLNVCVHAHVAEHLMTFRGSRPNHITLIKCYSTLYRRHVHIVALVSIVISSYWRIDAVVVNSCYRHWHWHTRTHAINDMLMLCVGISPLPLHRTQFESSFNLSSSSCPWIRVQVTRWCRNERE